MERPWLAALALVFAALLSWLAVSWPAEPRDSQVTTNEPPLAPETAAQPVAIVDPPKTQPIEPQPSAAPVSAASKPAAPAPPPSAAPSRPEAPVLEQGAVKERRERFEREPRDSDASEAEASLRAAFAHPDVPPALLESVLCRQSVCKVVVRLTPERLPGYIAAMTRVSAAFASDLAAAPSLPGDPSQSRSVEVFLERHAPAAEPK